MKSSPILRFTLLLLLLCGWSLPTALAEDPPAKAAAPFRIKWDAYDGNPEADEKMEFQLSTIDLRHPTLFLQLKQKIPNTAWVLTSFQYKTRQNPVTKEMDDVSELTITNTETKQKVVLIRGTVVDVNAPPPQK